MTMQAEARSLYEAFRDSAGRFGPRPMLRAPAGNTANGVPLEISYAEAFESVTALAAGYRAHGIETGDRVAVAFDSRLDVYLHFLALNAVGASMVPLSSAAGDAELAHIVSHSDSRLLVALPELTERLAGLANCEVVEAHELRGVAAAGDDAPGERLSEAALLYTSGTTGQPKGCMLSNDYVLALADWYVGLGGLCRLGSDDRLLTPLPPNHMNALCTSFPAMMRCGGCLIQLDRFHPRTWWRTVREERATVIHCLGVMTAILLTLPHDPQEDFSGQVRFCFGPGSDPRHQGAFEERFGIPLVEAWAMTESGAGGMTIAYREPRHVGQRCIGLPVETMEYRIVDESDRDVAPGDPGELLVRSKGDDPRKWFFSGYYKDPEATEAGWRGGWWHTGDVVRQGGDGSLYFVDRRKNVIRRSGENIAAVEVEGVLMQHPDIGACAVCAVPDEIRGDEVFAFVVSDGNRDARAVFDHCMAHLTYFKAPGYVAFVDQLPLTASQKISRGEVRKLAREAVLHGTASDLRALKKRKSA